MQPQYKAKRRNSKSNTKGVDSDAINSSTTEHTINETEKVPETFSSNIFRKYSVKVEESQEVDSTSSPILGTPENNMAFTLQPDIGTEQAYYLLQASDEIKKLCGLKSVNLYMLAPHLLEKVEELCPGKIIKASILNGLTEDGIEFLHLQKHTRDNSSERAKQWADSMDSAVQKAFNLFIELSTDLQHNRYDCFEISTSELEPASIDEFGDYETLMASYFDDRVIDSIDHPVIEKLKSSTNERASAAGQGRRKRRSLRAA